MLPLLADLADNMTPAMRIAAMVLSTIMLCWIMWRISRSD